MRRAALIGVVVLGLVALGVWWWWPEEVSTTPVEPTSTSPTQPLEGEFRLPESELRDAGVGRITGVVYFEEPAPGVKVVAYARAPELVELECGVCEMPVLECGEATTVRQLIDGVRLGKFAPPQPIAETVTDANGRFTFESLPLDAWLLARKDESFGLIRHEPEVEDESISLSLVETRLLNIVDMNGSPIPSAEVTLYSPWSGQSAPYRADADGVVTLPVREPSGFVFIDRPGFLPAGTSLELASQLMLSAPKTLIVHTRMGGQSVDADVLIDLHRRKQRLHAVNGELRIEQLSGDLLMLSAEGQGLSSPTMTVELSKDETEVTFELRRGGRLMVTVMTQDGEPLDVSGELSGVDFSANAEGKDGSLVIFTSVPEGEYELSLDAPDCVREQRRVDVKPGDNTLEVLFRPATKLEGQVLDPDGKPANDARVMIIEGEDEIESRFTREDGRFEVQLPYGGVYLVKALSEELGTTEQKVTAPKTDVVLKLEARASLEVELFDHDGKQIDADFMVRPVDRGHAVWLRPRSADDLSGRVAGLEAGRYVLHKDLAGRLPIDQQVELVEGRTTRLKITAKLGLTVTGRVVDANGKAIPSATIMTDTEGEHVTADELGHFEQGGLEPKELSIWAMSDEGVESERVKVTPPASDLVLKLGPTPRVRGRCIDERGAPVTEFMANDQRVKSADGRFEVNAPSKALDLWAEGREGTYLTDVTADVGDVVLPLNTRVEGEVVNPDGTPVAGATVRSSDLGVEASTDGRGRFKLELSTSTEDGEVIATRGGASGRTHFKKGQTTGLRVVMQGGSVVHGKVLDAEGRGYATTVTCTNRLMARPIEVQSNAEGSFEVELPRGVWLLAARKARAAKTIEVAGERVDVVLGVDPAARCSMLVTSADAMSSVWVLSRLMADGEAPWDVTASTGGSWEVSLSTPQTSVTVPAPCGKYQVSASVNSIVTTATIDLQGRDQEVRLPPPLSVENEPEPPPP